MTCLQRRSSADITGAVSLDEAKLGSLQQFVQADGDCEERGSSIFAVKEVSEKSSAFAKSQVEQFLCNVSTSAHLRLTTCYSACRLTAREAGIFEAALLASLIMLCSHASLK